MRVGMPGKGSAGSCRGGGIPRHDVRRGRPGAGRTPRRGGRRLPSWPGRQPVRPSASRAYAASSLAPCTSGRVSVAKNRTGRGGRRPPDNPRAPSRLAAATPSSRASARPVPMPSVRCASQAGMPKLAEDATVSHHTCQRVPRHHTVELRGFEPLTFSLRRPPRAVRDRPRALVLLHRVQRLDLMSQVGGTPGVRTDGDQRGKAWRVAPAENLTSGAIRRCQVR